MWNQLTGHKQLMTEISLKSKYFEPGFQLHPLSMTFDCAPFKQSLFRGSAEIVSFKTILNISKVERPHKNFL